MLEFFPIWHNQWCTNAQCDSNIENTLLEKQILVSTNLCFLDDNELHMSRGQEAQCPLTISSEEAVFGSLQKKEWLQSPRPLDPWDTWGSKLFQMPTPQRIVSFTLLLCPFPAETVKPCTYAKRHAKFEDHTDAAAQSLLHWTGPTLGTASFVIKLEGACFWSIVFVLHCRCHLPRSWQQSRNFFHQSQPHKDFPQVDLEQVNFLSLK